MKSHILLQKSQEPKLTISSVSVICFHDTDDVRFVQLRKSRVEPRCIACSGEATEFVSRDSLLNGHCTSCTKCISSGETVEVVA